MKKHEELHSNIWGAKNRHGNDPPLVVPGRLQHRPSAFFETVRLELRATAETLRIQLCGRSMSRPAYLGATESFWTDLEAHDFAFEGAHGPQVVR